MEVSKPVLRSVDTADIKQIALVNEASSSPANGTELLQEVLNLTQLPDEYCDALHTDLHDALVDSGVTPEVASLDDLRKVLLQYLEETNAEMNRELGGRDSDENLCELELVEAGQDEPPVEVD